MRRDFPLNDKINPCDNLYEYACSKTIESFKLREDRKRHSFAFNDSSERILEFKKKYVLDLSTRESKTPYFSLFNLYFGSVLNL